METRARRAVCERCLLVPPEIWTIVLSFLPPSAAVQSSLVCSDFAAIATPAAQQACRRLWPQHAGRLAACGPQGIQKFLKLVQAHEEEVAAHPDVEKAKSVQKTVCPEHRQIAVEWLIEVSWDWQLESTVVYRGAQYLDQYLSTHAVPALSKFQMLAISCLRTALKHSSKLAERERQRLPCKHWAEVTDGACTEAEVRNTCTKLDRMLHQEHRNHPNAKQRLRYLWYRLFDAGTVQQEHVYIYMMASFLLHLSLLHSGLSAVTPTKLATAALSLALKVFGFPPMPPVLAEHCFYLPEELQEVQQQLEQAQEEVVGQQLRALWVQSYSYVGTNPAQQPAYTLLQQVVTACGKLRYLPADKSSSSAKQENKAAATSAADAAPAAPSNTAGAAPLAAAPAAAPAAEAAEAGAGPAVHRVLTRAAAAAGLGTSSGSSRQQHQHTAVAAAVAAAAPGTAPEQGPPSRCAASSSHASSSRIPAGPLAAAAEADQGIVLATPQRPAALSTAHAMPQLQDFAPFALPHPALAAVGPAAAAAAAAAATPPASLAALAEAASSALQQPPSTGGSARRCATRELPPRRAVEVSRYGKLACRGSTGTPARSAGSAAADMPCSSRGAAAGPAVAAHQRSGLGHFPGIPLGHTAAAAAGPSSVPSDGAGPSSSHARPAVSAPPAGSMTPASPKHAAAGTRGLAALFAGVGHGGASISHTGVSSNTGRLLSGLPSLHSKSGSADSADLQRLSEEPAWLWSLQQMELSCYPDSKAGPSSNGNLHLLSVPVLRSTRRTAVAAAAHSAGGPSNQELLHKVHDRPGVHTRSSSSDGTTSQWHAAPGAAARSSHHE